MTLAVVHSIPSWQFLTEIKCTWHVALSKWAIDQFKPVQQSRQQALKAYCPNIYCVPHAISRISWHLFCILDAIFLRRSQKGSVGFRSNFFVDIKGQLISKCPFGVIVWTKIPTKFFQDFCPSL